MPHGGPHADPYVAYLTALQDAYAASGEGPNAFVPGAQGVPALGQAAGAGEGPGGIGGIGGIAGGVGAGGASVPGTATTGANLLDAIVTGGLPATSPAAAPLARRGLLPGEESTADRAGRGGGDVSTLLGLLSGGILAVPATLGSLVLSQAAGLPPSTGLLSAGGLAELAGLDGSTPGFGASGVDLGGAVPVGAVGAPDLRAGVPTGLSFGGNGLFSGALGAALGGAGSGGSTPGFGASGVDLSGATRVGRPDARDLRAGGATGLSFGSRF